MTARIAAGANRTVHVSRAPAIRERGTRGDSPIACARGLMAPDLLIHLISWGKI
jgi:hypothetical protein